MAGGSKKRRMTLNTISQAVRSLGYKNVRLYRGRDYYYWSGGVASKFYEQGVYGIRRLGDFTLNQWLNDFQDRVKASRR